MNNHELKVILEKHLKWMRGEDGGERANLRDADLQGADLREANLRGADLREANLRGADLQGADLQGANLWGANLRGADLRGANLRGANLWGANLWGADLWGANLRGADLRGANLREADLRGANLREANLWGANLWGADLWGADLREANLPPAHVPIINDIHKAVYQACSKENALDMSAWHTCETTHCRAGWVTTLAGEGGKVLEGVYGCGVAAAMIYMASDPKMEKIPNWTAGDGEALEDMKRLAEAS